MPLYDKSYERTAKVRLDERIQQLDKGDERGHRISYSYAGERQRIQDNILWEVHTMLRQMLDLIEAQQKKIGLPGG